MQTLHSPSNSAAAKLTECGRQADGNIDGHAFGRSEGSSSLLSPSGAYIREVSSADSACTDIKDFSERTSPLTQLDSPTTPDACRGCLKPARPKLRVAAVGAAAQARRKAIKAMRLIALAQHMAYAEHANFATSHSHEPSRVRKRPLVKKAQQGMYGVANGKRKQKAECQPSDPSRVPWSQQQSSGSHLPEGTNQSALVGARLSVLRPSKGPLQSFCKGEVTQLATDGLCGIEYDSGEHEWLQLGQQHFRLLGPRTPSSGLNPDMQAAMAVTSAVNRAEGCAVSPPRTQCCAPSGKAAVSGRVRVFFPGDGNQHAGSVLAHDPGRDLHLVLFDDGEDEWINISADASSWEPVQACSPIHGGLPPDTEPPAGMAAVGYNVAVYWTEDAVFYSARVTAFDEVEGTHTVSYRDGGVESLHLRDEIVKWLHQPQASTVPLMAPAELHGWLPPAQSFTPAVTDSRHASCLMLPRSALGSGLECNSPALLALPDPGSGPSSSWQGSREPSLIFDAIAKNNVAQPRGNESSQTSGQHPSALPDQASVKEQSSSCDGSSGLDICDMATAPSTTGCLHRPPSMPLLRSALSDDDVCGPMVPCGGFVPGYQSDPGPQLLSYPSDETDPELLSTVSWKALSDATCHAQGTAGAVANSVPELAPKCLPDSWGLSSSTLAPPQHTTDGEMDDLLRSFTVDAV